MDSKRHMSVEDFKCVYDVMTEPQDVHYWDTVPVPVRPIGRLVLEPIYQAAVFLVPIGLVALAVHVYGAVSLVWAVPVALLLGVLMDRLLSKAIARKTAMQRARDRGRYEVVRRVSHVLGMAPQDVTFRFLVEKAHAYREVVVRPAVEAEARAARLRAAEQRHVQVRTTAPTDRSDALHSPARPEVERNGSLSDGDDHWRDDHWQNDSVSMNPASALPMLGGSMGVDVAGNTFGSNTYN